MVGKMGETCPQCKQFRWRCYKSCPVAASDLFSVTLHYTRKNCVTLRHTGKNRVTLGRTGKNRVTLGHTGKNRVTLGHTGKNRVTLRHTEKNRVTLGHTGINRVTLRHIWKDQQIFHGSVVYLHSVIVSTCHRGDLSYIWVGRSNPAGVYIGW
jgi:hypothetical protein